MLSCEIADVTFSVSSLRTVRDAGGSGGWAGGSVCAHAHPAIRTPASKGRIGNSNRALIAATDCIQSTIVWAAYPVKPTKEESRLRNALNSSPGQLFKHRK